MRFEFVLVGIAALMVIMPVRSEAKKNRDMLSSQMTMKLPTTAPSLRVRNGKIRVRNGLAVSSKPLSIMGRKPMSSSPNSEILSSTFGNGKSMKPTIKLPLIKPPKNQRLQPFK